MEKFYDLPVEDASQDDSKHYPSSGPSSIPSYDIALVLVCAALVSLLLIKRSNKRTNYQQFYDKDPEVRKDL